MHDGSNGNDLPTHEKGKLTWNDKSQWPIVENNCLSTMIATYANKIVLYNKGRKEMTQFTLSVVWKVV